MNFVYITISCESLDPFDLRNREQGFCTLCHDIKNVLFAFKVSDCGRLWFIPGSGFSPIVNETTYTGYHSVLIGIDPCQQLETAADSNIFGHVFAFDLWEKNSVPIGQ